MGHSSQTAPVNHNGGQQPSRLTLVLVAVLFASALQVLAADAPVYSGLQPGQFMRRWLVLKPIPFAGRDEAAERQALAEDYLAAAGGEEKIRPHAGLKQKIGGQELVWQRLDSPHCMIDLQAGGAAAEYATTYACAEIDSPQATPAVLGIGSGNALKVWLNGKMIYEHGMEPNCEVDQHRVPVTLVKGKNQVLLKLQNLAANGTFCCRLVDETLTPPKVTAGPAISAGEVLRKALEARGGADAYANLHSFCAKGMIDLCQDSFTNSPVQWCEQRPNRMRAAIDLIMYDGQEFGWYGKGFDGRAAWTAAPGAMPKLLEGKMLEQEREDAGFFAWYADLASYQSAEVLGETTFEKQRCVALKVVSQSGSENIQYYDATTFLLAGTFGTAETELGPTTVRATYGDYRRFGGFQFPTSISIQQGPGDPTQYILIQFNSIKVNAVDESDVQMPAGPMFAEATANTRVPPGAYNAVAGRYACGDAILTVTREGDRIFAQQTGEGRHEIFPSSETNFFWKDLDARITFVKDATGKVTRAIHDREGDVSVAAKLP